MATDTLTVLFRGAAYPYFPGDVATLPRAQAQRYVDAGAATPHPAEPKAAPEGAPGKATVVPGKATAVPGKATSYATKKPGRRTRRGRGENPDRDDGGA